MFCLKFNKLVCLNSTRSGKNGSADSKTIIVNLFFFESVAWWLPLTWNLKLKVATCEINMTSLIHAMLISNKSNWIWWKIQKIMIPKVLPNFTFESTLNIEHIRLRKRYKGSKLNLKSYLKSHNSCIIIWRKIYPLNFWLV